ncbi:SHR3 [Candida theae]|uniref:SHR3 n=1 Tax=Candida theae TaxID=1198502 RepID=A0AAD5G145_9ASCO|nr:SHR3 [Candida theae]KAI5968360.1 SHR3 [Candida theae]
MMKYKDIVPIGTVLIIAATSFGLGAIYGNWPYDINTLWRATDPNAFSKSLLYKPDEDAKYFEYGSLGLFMIAIVIYLTNLRTGINAAVTGEWGEVDSATGINVIAASQVMIILVLVGVLVLQGGLYYAQWYDEQLKKEFYENEAREAALAAERQAKQEEDIIAGDQGANVEVIADKDGTAIDTKGKKKKTTVKKRKS